MNLTGIEKGLNEQIETEVVHRIRESITKVGHQIIEEEIGKMISKMHVVMTRSVLDDQIELRYVVSFKKDKA